MNLLDPVTFLTPFTDAKPQADPNGGPANWPGFIKQPWQTWITQLRNSVNLLIQYVNNNGNQRSGLLSAIPSASSVSSGTTYYATDYQHTYISNGVTWSYAPTDPQPSGTFCFSKTNPPRNGLWQLCDGSVNVKESLPNGTTALVSFLGLAAGTMPNMAAKFLRANSSCTGTVQPAVAPNFTGSAATMAIGANGGVVTGVEFPYTPVGTVDATGLPPYMDAFLFYRL